MAIAITTFATTFRRLGCIRCHSIPATGCFGSCWAGGRFQRRFSCIVAFRLRAEPALYGGQQRRFSGERTAVCQPARQGAGVSEDALRGVTAVGTKQWLNPAAFVSAVDPTTGSCTGGDSAANCQFGDAGRNTVRGPHFTYSDIYLTKNFSLTERVTFRFDTQMFNAFNHPNFALPSSVEAGVPGVFIPARFGTLESTISPPTGLLGVGLGGDSSPRMIAFQGRIEF